MDAADIAHAFDLAGEHSSKLKRLYSIYSERPSSCKLGALDFLHDYKFLLPAEKLVQQFKGEGKEAYRYLVDEPNPWQPSNGSHHAIDLVFLFGGFDMSFSPAAQKTGEHMRTALVKFVHSQEPWEFAGYAAFGPYGRFNELDEMEFRSRRRIEQAGFLDTVSSQVLDTVFFALAAGRISLLN